MRTKAKDRRAQLFVGVEFPRLPSSATEHYVFHFWLTTIINHYRQRMELLHRNNNLNCNFASRLITPKP
jgi:hypothetical protein